MKALISLLLLTSVVISGLTSYTLFRQSDYNTSAMLTIASYLSIVFCIYAVTMRSKKPAIVKVK
ncbi:MAG TPA: hypothetical protein VGM31_07250 [Puia sp.]|jgi:hypothetical protein